MRRLASLLALSCLPPVGGCGDEVTEIVIETRSDLSVPDELDEVRIDVRRPMQETQSAAADLTAPDGEPPRTLAVVHEGGPLGPVEVTVAGLRDGAHVVTRELVVSFERGERLRLAVTLDRACVGRSCDEDRTCAGGACRGEEVAPCEYEGRSCGDAGLDASVRDTGADAPLDGGAPDACRDRPEACNGIDDDCDDEVDEDFDLTSDPDHCGRCDRGCPTAPDNGTGSTCEEGSCVLQCDPSWGDCNRDPVDGCETDTETSMMHCGACGTFCPMGGTFHANDTVCSGGRCLLSCDDGWGDCDGDTSNGCETNVRVDGDHCGTCDNPCTDGEMCSGSTCG